MTARFFRAAVLMAILFFTGNLYAHSGKDSSVLQKIAEECTGKLKQRMQANATLRSTGRAKQQNFVVTVGFDEPPIDYDRHGYILEKNLTGVTPNYYSSTDLSMLQANINPKLVALYQQEQVEAYYLIVNYFNLYISRKAILDYSDANGNYNINAGLFNSSGGIFNSDIWNTFSNLEQLSNDFRSVTDEIAGSIFTATNRTMLLSVGKFCGKDLTMVDNSTFSIGCEYLANVAMNTKNNALMTEAAYSRIPAVLRSYLENNTSGASPVSLTNGHVDGMVQSVKQSKNVAKILSLQTYALLKPVLTNFSTAEYSALSVEERIHILKAIVTGTAAQVKDNMDNGGESTTMKVMRTVPKREAVVADFFDRLYSTGVLVSLYNNLTDASYMGLVGENNFSGFVNELSRLFSVKYNLLDSKKYEDLARTIGEDHTLYYGTYIENGNPSSSFITDYEEGAFTSIDMLPNGDIKVNDNSYIRSKFSNPAAYTPADEILPLEARNHVYKPFEPILCVLYSKPSYGGFDDKVIGKPFILPAIAFKWMKEKAWTYAIHASMVDVIKLTVNGAFVGSIGGATGWRLYADVAIALKTFADDVMRIPQINNAIRALPGGDEFLWYYQKCSMIADFAYISPYAFKFFKGFARSTYNLSKRGYQTITAFTENGWVKLKDYYAKVKETLAKNGIVAEELSAGGGYIDDLLLNEARYFDDNVLDVASVGFANWKTFQNRVVEQLKVNYLGKKIGNQITLDITYVKNGVTETKTIIPDNLVQSEVNGLKTYKVIDAKTANADLVNKADLTSTCTVNQQPIYKMIDGDATAGTIVKVEMRGGQATSAFGTDFPVGQTKIQIQLENGVEFWVNSSTTDFTQYLVRSRIR